jgi:hypothetical protein
VPCVCPELVTSIILSEDEQDKRNKRDKYKIILILTKIWTIAKINIENENIRK